VLRQIVGNLIPGCLEGDERVGCRAYAGVVIQGCQRNAIARGSVGVALRNGRPGAEFVYDRRTADAAEASEPAGRRLIEGDQLFTLYPFEISLGHACSAAKGSAVLLAAHGAVAVARPREAGRRFRI